MQNITAAWIVSFYFSIIVHKIKRIIPTTWKVICIYEGLGFQTNLLMKNANKNWNSQEIFWIGEIMTISIFSGTSNNNHWLIFTYPMATNKMIEASSVSSEFTKTVARTIPHQDWCIQLLHYSTQKLLKQDEKNTNYHGRENNLQVTKLPITVPIKILMLTHENY